MPQCCAVGCFSQQIKGRLFHCLPSEKCDSVRRAIWIHRIDRKDWAPNSNSRLCEDHFTSDQYEQNRIDGRRKLKPNAIPSIFRHNEKSTASTSNTRNDISCMVDRPSTNDDPVSEESNIILDACSVDFSRTESPRPIPEHSFEIEKQELLWEVRLLRKKNQKLEAEKKQLESAIRLLFNDDQLRFLAHGNIRGSSWSMSTIQTGLKLRNICGNRGYSLLRDKKIIIL